MQDKQREVRATNFIIHGLKKDEEIDNDNLLNDFFLPRLKSQKNLKNLKDWENQMKTVLDLERS